MIRMTKVRSFIGTVFALVLILIFIGVVAALMHVRVPVISNFIGR